MPINFLAVRLAENLVHPRVLNATAGDMPGEMRLTFLVSLLGDRAALPHAVKLELTSKHARGQLKRLRRLLEEEPPAGGAASTPLATVPARPTTTDRDLAPMPALPLDEAGKYVAGAYGVFVDADPRLRRDHGRPSSSGSSASSSA